MTDTKPANLCAIPETCAVMLIGASASGKSTFARKHFKPTEILSSDAFRGMVADNEDDQTVTKEAFELLYNVAEKRLRRGKLVVFDATNVQPFAVDHIVRLVSDHYCRTMVFAFGLSLTECLANNQSRDRKVPEDVIRRHVSQYRQIMRNIRRYKGIRNIWTFDSNAQAAAAQVVRTPSRHRKHVEDSGPFDVIGDIHGCAEEMLDLLEKLGYEMTPRGYVHPQGRKAVFVGDYVDRGPSSLTVLGMVKLMAEEGHAYCLPGNHDVRLDRKLRKGSPEDLLKNPSKLTHGLQMTLEDLKMCSPKELRDISEWIGGLPSHLILDHGKLVVSHAGLREEMIGRSHGSVREFCLYGNRVGNDEDADGFPIREDWAKDYRGKALIAYGHIHAGVAEFRNNTICLDTNVYMGGTLTALRYPEREIVSVPAKKVYFVQAPRNTALTEMAPGTRVCIADPRIAEIAPAGRIVSAVRKDYDGQDIVDVALDGGGTQAVRVKDLGAEAPFISPTGRIPSDPPHPALPGTGVNPALSGKVLVAPDFSQLEMRIAQSMCVRSTIVLTPEGSATVTKALEKPPCPTPALNHLFGVKDDLVDIADLIDKRRVDTRLVGPVSFNRDMAAAALEQISRFSVDPRWLIYLPPTMSPCEAAPEGDFLERPEEAFAYYRERNIPWVVCEEKHMGSRLIAVVCRDEKSAFERFGVSSSVGACYTRLGRPFFPKPELEKGVLDGVREAMDRAGLWEKLNTNWICLDCELMPWSAKAGGLLHRLYAGAGRAGSLALRAETHALVTASMRGRVVGQTDRLMDSADESKLMEMAGRWHCREGAMERYVEAYRRYCWSTDGLTGLKLAPFHVLATEGHVHADKSNLWHVSVGQKLASGSHLLVSTPFRLVSLVDPVPVLNTELLAGCRAVAVATPAEASEWWYKMTIQHTEAGDFADVEGMVVKPLDFTPPADERFGRVQPALKCRGREYLRIIYGPEYTTQLEKLRKRGLNSKRRLAAQEFALGIESLERFVQKKPLAKVHECAFAVLALECEPLDPRL